MIILTSTTESSATLSNDTLGEAPSYGLRAAVSIVCVLSMVGATLIVLSYALLPVVRTKPGSILLHISLMDLLTAGANLVGVVLISTRSDHGAVCVVQASLSMYGTLGSVLWTSALAVYVYAAVLYSERRVGRHTLRGFSLLCYGLPLAMTLWFALTRKLGPDPLGGASWCSLVLHADDGRSLPFNVVFGNDIWMYVTVILVLVLFVPMHCYLKYQHFGSSTINDGELQPEPSLSAELKLISVPVVFIMLRIWSVILGVTVVELGYDLTESVLTFLLYMSGIGDSAQGFANSVIFLLFTPDVRRGVVRFYRKHCCSGRVIIPPNDLERSKLESTSQYEESQPFINARSILIRD